MAIAGIAAWLALAVALYAPSGDRPFDIVDFPQFLPLLKANRSSWAEFRAIADFYATEGRMSILAYALLVLKWKLFGNWVVGWQLVRFAQMLGIAGLLFTLLRRWDISRLGAYCASTLILCSQASSIAWIRLNMSEPLGFALLLTMLHLATNAPPPLRGWRSPVILGVLATASLLMKEMHVATFPAILWAYAAFDDHGSSRPLTIDRRVWLAVAALAVASLVVLLPVAYVALTAPAQAYSRSFGAAPWSPFNAFFSMFAILVPFPLLLDDASPLLYVALFTYLLLLAAGARAYLVTAADSRIARDRLLLGALFPICCVVAYAPWPNFSLLYVIPYLLGPALLLGAGITGIQRAFGRASPWIGTSFVLVLVPMVASASTYTRRIDSYLRLSLAIVQFTHTLPQDRPLVAAACELPLEPWRDIGFALYRYGRSRDLDLPPFRDVSCTDARRLLLTTRRDSAVLIVTATPRLVPSDATILRSGAWSFAFPQLRPRWNEVVAVVLPASR